MFDSVRTTIDRVKAVWADTVSTSHAAGYDVVTTRGNGKRRIARIESAEEDQMLNASQRLKVLNLTRDGMRNAPAVRAIVQQLRVLMVGLEGGKLTCTTEDEDWNKAAQTFFGKWARACDFVDNTCLNECLKLMITCLHAEGGDFCMIFDDGILTGGRGTGKIRFFESDNIANLNKDAFAKRFGNGYTQSNGLVYNSAGRFCGIVVSGKKRGLTEYNEDQAFVLTRDPDKEATDAAWFFGKKKWRLLQGRGISPQTVAIAALLDMYEIVASEVQTGKLNSKLFSQVIDTLGASDGSDGSEVVDTGATDAGDIDERESTTSEQSVEIDVRDWEATAGAKTVNVPFGTKLEVFDSKRPSTNLYQFAEMLLGGAAAVHGLARVYSGLKAETSYTAFRGEQTISWASIEEAHKDLERGPCDWVGVKVLRWAMDTGQLSEGPEGWETALSWSWPKMKEVNELDSQNAITAKLRNCIVTYRSILGPNWKEILTQVSREVKWFSDNGLIHPSQQTVSGQVVTSGGDEAKRKDNDNETD